MSRTQAEPAPTTTRKPVTFRLRSDLIRMVEAAAEREGVDRSSVLEKWTEDRLEILYPGCTGRSESQRSAQMVAATLAGDLVERKGSAG